jgi:hypothetical protein
LSERARTVLLLVGILALALALRVVSAGGFWIDEVFSAANAKAGPSTFVERLQGEPHSPWPIYYLLLHGWQRLFPSVEGMKALSILLSMAHVLAMIGVGRALFGARAGWIAGLLAAGNPLLAWYGGEIRMYALMVLLLTGAIGAAVRAVRTRRAADGILFAGLAALAVYAHVFAAFPVLVLTVGVVARAGRRAALASLGFGAALATPAALLALDQARHWLSWKSGVADGYVSSPMNLVAAVQSFFTGYALPLEGVDRIRLAAVLGLGLLVGGLVLSALVRRVEGRWLLLALVAVGLVAPWLVMLKTRMFSPRFALAALPPLLLLVAAVLARRRLVASLSAAVPLVIVGSLAVFWAPGRTDWRDVAEKLEAERKPDEPLYFEGGNLVALREWFGPCFEGESFAPGPNASWHRDDAPRIWFVEFLPEVDDLHGYIWFGEVMGPERTLIEDQVPIVKLVRFER